MALALDYCVNCSVLDTRHLGLNTHVILEEFAESSLILVTSTAGLMRLKRAGATILKSSDL